MIGRFLALLVVVGVPYSTVSGEVHQSQHFVIPATNMVVKTGGVGCVVGGNLGTVMQDQTAWGGCRDIAVQQQTGTLNQGATAAGMCGNLTVWQGALAEGSQSQGPGVVIQVYPTPPVPQIQEQELNVGLAQGMTKEGGPGVATGTQAFQGGQHQMAASGDRGIASQSQLAGATQCGVGAGGPCSCAVIVQAVDVTTDQTGLVSEPGPCPAPPSPLPCVTDWPGAGRRL